MIPDEETNRLAAISRLKLERDKQIQEISQSGGPEVDVEALIMRIDSDYLTAIRRLAPPLSPIITRTGKIVDVNVKMN